MIQCKCYEGDPDQDDASEVVHREAWGAGIGVGIGVGVGVGVGV